MVRGSDVLFPRGPYALLGVQAIPASAPADPDNDIEIPRYPPAPLSRKVLSQRSKTFPTPPPPLKIHTHPKSMSFEEGIAVVVKGLGVLLVPRGIRTLGSHSVSLPNGHKRHCPRPAPTRSAPTLRYRPYWSCIWAIAPSLHLNLHLSSAHNSLATLMYV
jgi:hypothetical protein